MRRVLLGRRQVAAIQELGVSAGGVGCKNIMEVSSECVGKLLRGGGFSALRILKVGNSILPVSLDDRMMKESGVAVADGPLFLGTLDMVFFILG